MSISFLCRRVFFSPSVASLVFNSVWLFAINKAIKHNGSTKIAVCLYTDCLSFAKGIAGKFIGAQYEIKNAEICVTVGRGKKKADWHIYNVQLNVAGKKFTAFWRHQATIKGYSRPKSTENRHKTSLDCTKRCASNLRSIRDVFREGKGSFSTMFQPFDLVRLPNYINYNDKLSFVVIIH